MIKPRTIIIAVCGGFVLSFVIGLIAGVSFSMVLLRALIFAVLFGVLSFGIEIVCRRFLLDSSDLEGSAEVPAGARQGSIVDLSVGDEPLVEDENGPDFYVRKEIADNDEPSCEGDSKNRHPLSAAAGHDGGASGSATSQDAPQEQFRPIALGSPAVDDGGGRMVVPGFANGGSDASDDLPEIGDIAIHASEGDDFSSGGMEFSIGNGMETSQGRGSSATSEDSSTIAQAIRTVLARDS